MKNPALLIHKNKLKHNLNWLGKKIHEHDISITGVTKVFCADPRIMQIYNESPYIQSFGDSRMENIRNYPTTSKKKILIRLPMHSEVKEVITYTDMSFNSELTTIKALNEEAKRQGKMHQILLMVDLGDLREGYFDEKELLHDIAYIQKELDAIEIVGLGTNLTCYGAIIPDEKILNRLVRIASDIKNKFGLDLPILSGGNSSSLYLLDSPKQQLPSSITNIRIGEAFLLGRETAFEQTYSQMYQDVFTLRTEIIELKEKPSYPIGEIGVDVFGNKPVYEDKGIMKRAILAIGKQDVYIDGLIPLDTDIDILGASSDHLIVDVSQSEKNYVVGDTIEFHVSYGSLLALFTSKYVTKIYEE